MFEQLSQILQQQGQQSVVENPDVPNEHNGAVLQEANNSIFDGLKNLLAKSNPQDAANMLQNGDFQDAANPAVSQISGSFVENISRKFGISPERAQSIAATLIPMVLSKLTGKAKDPNETGFNIQDMLGNLQGGNLQQTASNVGAKLGLDKDGDGDVDMGDLGRVFSR